MTQGQRHDAQTRALAEDHRDTETRTMDDAHRTLDQTEQKWLQERWHKIDQSGDGMLDLHEQATGIAPQSHPRHLYRINKMLQAVHHGHGRRY